MISTYWSSEAANHLWQSTAFVAVAWLVTLALRKNQARVRFWIWMAASLKFLVPFSVLIAMGDYLRPTHAVNLVQPTVTAAVAQVVTPFMDLGNSVGHAVAVNADYSNLLLTMLMIVWAAGFFGVSAAWWLKWRRVRAMVRGAQRGADDFVHDGDLRVPVVTASALLEPGIFGIWRPVLILPEGICDRLTPEQLRAIVAHEICHVQRRDNFTAAIHMAVEAAFWFHPAVWWIGRQMVEERERACDEEVLRRVGDADSYAEGILEVCKIYTESPVVCVSGISGADLKARIVRIMTQRFGERLTLRAKAMLGAAGAVAITLPLIAGMLGAARAQDVSGPLPSFEVASIKLAPPGGRGHGFQMPDAGRFRTINASPKLMIQFAYGVKDFQVLGGPSWADSNEYNIDAKVDDSFVAAMQKMPEDQRREQMRLMMRSLLVDRFKLSVSHDTKELPIFALVVARGGPKLTPTTFVPPDPSAPKSDARPQGGPQLLLGPGKITGVYQPMSGLADLLALVPDLGGRVVQDQTGIQGRYDFEMHFSMQPFPSKGGDSPPADASTTADTVLPSIFTALEEQMGLRLESTKGPVDTYTIDHIEEPSEN